MSHSYLFFGLTWTLDGQQVVVVPGIGTKSGSLWKVAADGSGRRELMPFAGDEVANPSVSRQGGRVAYAYGAVEDRNIWRLDLIAPEARRSPQKICSSTRHDASAQFSPDGKRIAFRLEPIGQGRDLGVQQRRHERGADYVARRPAMRHAALVAWRR